MKYFHQIYKLLFPYYGTIFKRIGGEKSINLLVDEFYWIMQNDPKASHCLATHAGRDLSHSAKKLKFFLSGWLGGPQLFLKHFGHPRLRMRHFPFAIGDREAAEWLYCMEEALKKTNIKAHDQKDLLNAFRGMTDLIKNRS